MLGFIAGDTRKCGLQKRDFSPTKLLLRKRFRTLTGIRVGVNEAPFPVPFIMLHSLSHHLMLGYYSSDPAIEWPPEMATTHSVYTTPALKFSIQKQAARQRVCRKMALLVGLEDQVMDCLE